MKRLRSRLRTVLKAAPAYPAGPNIGLAAKRYGSLLVDREPYLMRARRASLLTIPSVYRQQAADGTQDTPVAWQSFGAYCVNTLVSKLSISMFPPGLPFMRLDMSKDAIADLAVMDEDARGELKSAIAKGLGGAEREFVNGVDEDGDTDRLIVALRKLVLGGNHCIQMYQDASIRGVPFENWVCIRDKQGNLLEWIIKDSYAFETLEDDIKEIVRRNGYREPGPDSTSVPVIDVYTHATLKNKKFHIYQECYSERVPDTDWTYIPEASPYIFIPFNLLDGEHYGRGYVEDFEGDLQTLDALEQTVTEGSAAAALFVRLVKPGGVTNKTALAQAQNGDVITGDTNDVATLESGKNNDWQTALNRIQEKEARLGRAFLLNSTVQRSGDRVTAEEIRYVAQELQDNLGGVYSSQVTWFQRPYVTLKMAKLQATGRMTPLPKKSVRAKLVTGAAALGRNAELQALDSLVTVPPAMQQEIPRVINSSLYFQRRATALGVDQEGLVKTEKDLADEAQQAQQQQQMMQAGPDLLKGGTAIVTQQMKNQGGLAQTQLKGAIEQAAQQGAASGPEAQA